MRRHVSLLVALGLLASGASLWGARGPQSGYLARDPGFAELLAPAQDPEDIRLSPDASAALSLALGTPMPAKLDSLVSQEPVLRLAASPAALRPTPYGPALRVPAPVGLADLAVPETRPVSLAALAPRPTL